MADYLPKFKPGQAVTFTASADIVGGREVAVSGNWTVATAGADAIAIGTAAFDVLSGEKVTVFLRGGGVHSLIAAGAIAAGARVITATGGKVATIASGSNPIGVALKASAADLDVIDVLYL